MTGGFPFAQTSWDLVGQMAVWLVVTAGAVVVLGVVLVWARKYAQRSARGGADAPGPLSIERLEKMHRDGLISHEEFSALRRTALGLGPAAAGKAPPGLTQPSRDVDESRNREETERPPSAEPPRG